MNDLLAKMPNNTVIVKSSIGYKVYIMDCRRNDVASPVFTHPDLSEALTHLYRWIIAMAGPSFCTKCGVRWHEITVNRASACDHHWVVGADDTENWTMGPLCRGMP